MMAPDLPMLSVIVPVFNGADTLAEALGSILAQEGAVLKIIVIDDGSTDASAAIACSFGDAVVCISQANQGPAAARNCGLQLAHGEFVSFLDSDDRWPVGRVYHHIGIMAEAPEIDMVIGTTQVAGLAMMPGEPAVTRLPAPMIQQNLGAVTMRRRVFDHVGLFDPALHIGEDKAWFQRALTGGVTLKLVSAIALEYRVRPGSLTYGTINHGHWFLTALRNHLRQRRKDALQENHTILTNKSSS